MIFTLIYILLAGLLLKSFHTHFISEKRKYFSFDDRRFTDDDYLKVQDLKIGQLERIFLSIMLLLLVGALAVHLFIDPVISIWLIALFVAAMLLLSVIVDLRLYTVAYDKSHLVMAGIWVVIIIGIFVFLFMRSTDDVEVEFRDDAMMDLSNEVEYRYSDMDSVEMVSALPDIPFNHNLLGTFSQVHGYVQNDGLFHALRVEDRSKDMIRIEAGDAHLYLNDRDEAVTDEWYNALTDHVE